MEKKTLILIESPNKRHCIENALGTDNYVVMASVGNVYDLPPNEFGIDVNNDFKANYIVMKDKTDIVENIKKMYLNCKDVILATDQDVEGEGIAWGLAQILGLKSPIRMLYNDTNKKTVQTALQNLVPLNKNKVDAQHCRRYLDRIIGYKLSPLLWKAMNTKGALSAGRVQSVACRLIIEKHFEVEKFFANENLQSYFKTTAQFDNKYKATLYTTIKKDVDSDVENEIENELSNVNTKLFVAKIESVDKMKEILINISKSEFVVSEVTEKNTQRNSCEPFHTTTICQEASRKLGMSTERTMNAAQNLFAYGFCTYHRTDSVTLSDEALNNIKNYVVGKYGQQYHKEKQYKNKKSGTQGAHECLRVIDPNVVELEKKNKIGDDEVRLYKLIWRRTIASQMASAKFKNHCAEINISELQNYKFITEYEECVFDGFLKVYNPNANDEKSDDDNNNDDESVPNKNSILKISNTMSIQEFRKPPTYYDESSFLGKLKTLNIGRPATVKSIISKIQQANYVILQDVKGIEKTSVTLKLNKKEIKEEEKKIMLGKEKKKFVPTELGMSITKFLVDKFPQIMDYEFTSLMEDKLDDIEDGKIDILDVLDEFCGMFYPLLKKIDDDIADKNFSLQQMVELGKHPVSGHRIYKLLAKYGPIVKMFDDEKVIAISPIKLPLTLENITLLDAIELLKYPVILGTYNKETVKICKGQFGFYIECGNLRASLNPDSTDETVAKITLKDVIEKLEEKKSNILWEGKNTTYNFTVLNGQYGRYICAKPIKQNTTAKLINCSLPKDIELDKLTVDKVVELIKAKKEDEKKKIAAKIKLGK